MAYVLTKYMLLRYSNSNSNSNFLLKNIGTEQVYEKISTHNKHNKRVNLLLDDTKKYFQALL